MHVLQLRHASEREKVIAEDGQVITTPWTFGDVAAKLNKGAFEDLVEDRALRREQKPDDRGAKQKRRKFGFANGEHARRWKRQSGEIGGDESQADDPARKEREPPASRRDRERQRTEEEEFFQEIFGEDKDVDGSRLVDDADYLPMNAIPASTGGPSSSSGLPDPIQDGGELLRNELFQRAKRRHELEDRPQHVIREQPEAERDADEDEMGFDLQERTRRWNSEGESSSSCARLLRTMTRRSRQLLLQMAAHRGWRVTKADARAAFLQGGETQLQRQVFGLPVEELATAMNLPKGRAVQFLKATYGLTVAPREWFLKVGAILTEAGMNRLKTEPCMWSLKAPDMNREDGKQRALGFPLTWMTSSSMVTRAMSDGISR